ncbi:hypothetical protein B4073_0573 [Bacillus subtilis]|uniref:Uncharacterized protein n=1 Tax=Bacillus subtilis subsp. subtilis TaxID=135461 RepID=A0ABD3ZRZ7_BACIU|nr:hypothetical protein B4067_4771 [Bacillus subtilis subsp. subtilis]KIN26287.1 hypothetical protein B4068_0567 [Bacillus subtilis]KIN26923.1 hypothetical protein B4069_0610 [Bacillus subtilis]KIN37834.1 hypothetical protein B4070_0644 [Bacillus subtilis]KIN41528.1 hypothetical protein B4072_0607 [Bacillus subtilis]
MIPLLEKTSKVLIGKIIDDKYDRSEFEYFDFLFLAVQIL